MSQDPPFYSLSEHADGITTITVSDPSLLSDEKEALYGLLDRPDGAAGPGQVVLNLEGIRAFKSVMLGVLINFQKKLRELGGSLKLCGLDPHVTDMFRLIHLDEMFEIHATEREAVEAFQNKDRPGLMSRFFGAK
jgi:anti-sigma B factor antagonist